MEQFRRRITELADRAYAREIVMFSDFLDLHQQTILQGIRWREHGVHPVLRGGYALAERRMAAFVPDTLYLPPAEPEDAAEQSAATPEAAPGWLFPFRILSIRPSAPRYAEPLSHRDYLGSVLALGIERSTLGDLIVREQQAWLICTDRMADYLQQELTRVKHTQVLTVCSDDLSGVPEPAAEERVGSVASLRLDALIALAFGIARSRAGTLVQEGAVFVNAKQTASNGHPPRAGDLISVRGLGKCRFCGVVHETKKGRLMVRMERFV